jgi:drug/metabolite transporter (DMT)-like permease
MTAQPGTSKAVMLAFAGIYIIWGTTFIGIALAIRTLPPFFSGAIRFFIAGAIMYVWLRAHEPRPFARLNIGGSVLCGVLLSGIGNGFVIWSQQGLPSGIAALFVGALPVMMLLLDWLLFSHRAPTPRGVLGVAIGLSGVVLLIAHTHTLSGQVRPLHVLAILTAQLGWALGSLLQPRYVPPDRLPNYSCLQMLAGAGFQLLMGCIGREWIGFSFAQVSLQSWLALLYLVVFGSLIAVNCYSYLLAHVPPQQVSTYALVNPVIALILGALMLHEIITPLAALCALLVVVGVALVLWRGPRRSSASTQCPVKRSRRYSRPL